MRAVKAFAVLFMLAGCEREERVFRPPPTAETAPITQSSIAVPTPNDRPEGARYEKLAYQISKGKELYSWFNCKGCHANGGGDSGPALMDDKWIYGSAIENIAVTIAEGRPNGMPSFRNRATSEQIWQLAAYVRSLAGQVSSDAAPGRNDDMRPHEAESRLPSSRPMPAQGNPEAR
jgi:cytochrome c oxidase cbb3-type subunit III